MLGRYLKSFLLTNAVIRRTAFLTLTALFIFPHPAFAYDESIPTPDQIEADKERASQVTSYIRKQLWKGASILPNEVRQTASWFSGTWRPMSLSDDDDDTPETPNLPGAPDKANITTSNSSNVGVSSNFHHKGFLPTHDAMVMGVNLTHNMFDDKLGVTARPFYGQSWYTLRGYAGGEIALDIANRPDDMPWGKIAIGYVTGQDELTDHGTGVEMHGDVDLTHGFKFVTGLRQNSADGNSNYMMINWKMNFQ